MVTIAKDKKSPTWIITVEDSLGFHRQVNVTKDDLCQLYGLIGHELDALKNY